MINTSGNIILHIPHSSIEIPFMEGFVIDENELKNEINLLTDWFTDDLFNLPFSRVLAQFSRLFCDVERFPDDASEIMASRGMGMCYTHFDSGMLMRTVDTELRDRIKTSFYDPHHEQLESLTTDALTERGKVNIIDCHSFEESPNKRDLNKEMPRPDFCIGADDFHTPHNLTMRVVEFLSAKGYSVKVNNPYSGTIIPLKYYLKESNVVGIMIEVNRRLYMNSENGSAVKSENFNNIKTLITGMVKEINQYLY